MKRTVVLSMIALVAFAASPAMADLFNFNYNILQSSYTGGPTGTFSATVKDGRTLGSVTAFDVAPQELATFNNDWAAGPENATFTMDISNIANGAVSTADGDGGFLLYDKTGDWLEGHIDGVWTYLSGVPGAVPTFAGVISNVTFQDGGGADDGQFDGDVGFVTMDFANPPWEGMLIEMTTSGLWFNGSWTNMEGGGVIANVVPLPGAVLLGMLGLAAAGRKLRKMC